MLIVLTGKTASGKDTVMLKLLSKLPSLKRVITTTSRAPRPGEQDKVDYNFVSPAEFKHKIDQGDFIEYVNYAGNWYGTEKAELDKETDLIWRIDPSRAGQIKQLLPNQPALVIYLNTPDKVVLERLQKRGLSEEEIASRMKEDNQFWQQYQGNYQYVVENIPGQLQQTVDKIAQILENHSLK